MATSTGKGAPPSSIDSDRAISDCLHQKPTIFLYVHIQDSQNHALQTHLLWQISQSSDAVFMQSIQSSQVALLLLFDVWWLETV